MVLSQYRRKMSKPDVFDESNDIDAADHATKTYSAAGLLPLIGGALTGLTKPLGGFVGVLGLGKILGGIVGVLGLGKIIGGFVGVLGLGKLLGGVVGVLGLGKIIGGFVGALGLGPVSVPTSGISQLPIGTIAGGLAELAPLLG